MVDSTNVAVVEPHTEIEVSKLAEDLGISIERARFIETMREFYILHEYDYSKKSCSTP